MLSPLASLSRRICGKHTFHRRALMMTTISFSSVADDGSKTRTAFVGLGNMGLPMALNVAITLPDSTDIMTVYDMQESNTTNFFEQVSSQRVKKDDYTNSVVLAADDLKSIGEWNPHAVITSLPTCEASEAVVSTIVQHLPTPTIDDKGCKFIDTSTISPNISKKLHQLVTSVSPLHTYTDAPVSGGVKGATDGTLTFMVGCSPDELDSIIGLLNCMGKKVIPCGSPGSGSAVKLCNNAALAAQMLGICEAMNLGEALGVDPKVLAGVMNVSTAKCWSSEVNNPHPAAANDIGSGASANGYEGGFGTSLMLKDLNLAVDAGEEEGLALPVTGISRDLYRMASLHGLGSKDFGVLLEFLKGNK